MMWSVTSSRSSTTGNSLDFIEFFAHFLLRQHQARVRSIGADLELAALKGGLGNYSGASLILSRHESAFSQDAFSATGHLIFAGNKAIVSGVTVDITSVNTPRRS